MDSLISSQKYEVWDPETDYPILDGSKNDVEGKYTPQTSFDYLYECCLIISDVRAWRKIETRASRNREIVAEYKRTHACERCGIRSDNPFKFGFFEMHLAKKDRIGAMVSWARPEKIKAELSTRGMFCRKCYRLISREVTDNIPAPPVKSDLISF